MCHGNAAPTPRARLQVAQLIVEDRWPVAVAARILKVSPGDQPQAGGEFPLKARRGWLTVQRPPSMPNKTRSGLVKRTVRLRLQRRLGPAQISEELGIPASRMHVLLGAAGSTCSPFRPVHRRADTPLRTRLSRAAEPRRRDEVSQHPGRRPQPSGPAEISCHSWVEWSRSENLERAHNPFIQVNAQARSTRHGDSAVNDRHMVAH